MITLKREHWYPLHLAHRKAVAERLGDYLERRSRHEKDPVFDFLFEYYAFRPSHLERWSPGLDTMLEIQPEDVDVVKGLHIDGCTAHAAVHDFPEQRLRALHWVIALLEQTSQKSPSFHCGGMHEWAMMYNSPERRHEDAPLRLPQEHIDALVRDRGVGCTHFDAFRFFTEAAVPLNRFALQREHIGRFEQAGCLHANMDVYKWAFKYFPWISSDLILQAFDMAVEARTIDMQASPYDWSDWGLNPIKIETAEGLTIYKHAQMRIYEQAKPLREAVLCQLRSLRDRISTHQTLSLG